MKSVLLIIIFIIAAHLIGMFEPYSGLARILSYVIGIPLMLIGFGIGNALRLWLHPDAVFASGFWGLLKAKLFWGLVPQIIGAFVGLALGLFIVSNIVGSPEEQGSEQYTRVERRNDVPNVNPTPLLHNTWTEGTVSVNSEVSYSFDVTTGTTYVVMWNDSHEGDGTKTTDIYVEAYYSNNRDTVFSRTDSAWSNPQIFTANRNGTVILRVISPYRTGTFAIGYTTNLE